MNKPDPVARAKAGWGHAVPEWVMGLAKACAATSQNKVALRMRDMTDVELTLVVDRLKAAGFKATAKSKKRPPAPRKDLRLIHVLWSKLGEAGALRDPTRAGLNKFIRARFEKSWAVVPADVDMLREWAQIDDVIQALKSWGERTEIDFDWEDHWK